MPAEGTTASNLLSRISAFGRTRTFIALVAFIAGVNLGIILTNYEHQQTLRILEAKIDANRAQIDSIKRSGDQQK
jgi:uncharacterized membrane-anchored protein YhcB (DUF1043 family)